MGVPYLWAAALWALSILNYAVFRDALYPGFIQSVTWAAAVTLFAFFADAFVPVSATTLAIIGLGALAFSCGAFLTTHGHVARKLRAEVSVDRLPSGVTYAIAGGLVLAFLGPMFWEAEALAAGGPFDNSYRNLRYSLTTEGETYGRLMYAVWLSYVTATMFLLKALSPTATKRWRWLAAIFFAVALAYAVFVTGRGFVLFLMLVVGGVLVLQRAVRPWILAALGVAAALALFAAYGVVLNKGGSVDANVAENAQTLGELLVVYLVSSIPAFDQVVRYHGGLELGANSLSGINSTLNSIGFDFEVKPLVQPFVSVPFPTNIYTTYQPYYQDFGALGALLILALLGAVHGYVYRRATASHPRPVWILVYAIGLYPLTMQYQMEYYLSYFKQWLVFGLLIACFSLRLKVSERLRATAWAGAAARRARL